AVEHLCCFLKEPQLRLSRPKNIAAAMRMQDGWLCFSRMGIDHLHRHTGKGALSGHVEFLSRNIPHQRWRGWSCPTHFVHDFGGERLHLAGGREHLSRSRPKLGIHVVERGKRWVSDCLRESVSTP